jgi:hypothetical protein
VHGQQRARLAAGDGQAGANRIGVARRHSKGAALNIDSKSGFARSIQGQLLRQNERREVAIFLRDGALWVADFIDGEGKLIAATTWFRFNCGALSSPQARRRMVLESAVPLSEELIARIGQLKFPATSRDRGPMTRLIEAITACRARIRVAGAVARVLDRRRRIRATTKIMHRGSAIQHREGKQHDN